MVRSVLFAMLVSVGCGTSSKPAPDPTPAPAPAPAPVSALQAAVDAMWADERSLKRDVDAFGATVATLAERVAAATSNEDRAAVRTTLAALALQHIALADRVKAGHDRVAALPATDPWQDTDAERQDVREIDEQLTYHGITLGEHQREIGDATDALQDAQMDADRAAAHAKLDELRRLQKARKSNK